MTRMCFESPYLQGTGAKRPRAGVRDPRLRDCLKKEHLAEKRDFLYLQRH